MQNSNDKEQSDVNLQIIFPKSAEDHRLQLVEINGSVFAILHSSLESDGPINLDCKEWSLVLLAPIKSKMDIEISAVNIICLSEIKSEEGTVNIQASNRLVKLGPRSNFSEKLCESGQYGVFQLNDDPAAFFKYFRMFNKLVNNICTDSQDSYTEAEQRVIMSLCLLAEEIEGKKSNLNIHKVLGIWGIPLIN